MKKRTVLCSALFFGLYIGTFAIARLNQILTRVKPERKKRLSDYFY